MTEAPLSGRRALVTGGSRGIGRATAARLIAAGAAVTITARTEADARRAGDELGCAALAADVRDAAAMERAFAAAAPLDILVNNAGIALSRPVAKLSLEDWNEVIGVDLTGAFLGCRLALPGMVERGWGRIVNVASTAGLRPYLYTAAYCAAKHGLIGLTRALALETARQGVTVNAVCPGFTATDMAASAVAVIEAQTGRSADAARAALERLNPQNRLTDPDEVAAAIIFLCRPDSHGITGQSLIIAGGEVM
jgi:NAD(P)-dependent dehydrogenase (short-subunit alcohol dehydrogenase family)